ncbi:hypothetical protein [Nocardia lijiangensis]|uniref:hypothetical protein n=1 Tax=Nocardia lijiangensis TaxID=299618 RepID=UPI003D70F7FD
MTSPPEALSDRPAPVPHIRVVASVATVAATLPYLTLKTNWIAGGTLGVRDPEFLDSSTMTGLNLVTLAMDAIAVAFAIVLVAPWGRRAPGWIVLLPAWIAGGLLIPIVLAAPLGLALDSGAIDDEPDFPLATWVFPLVYGGFTVQGIGLAVGFFCYGVERWGGLIGGRVGDDPRPARQWRELVLLAAAPALVTGLCTMLWGWGVPGGLSEEMDDNRNAAFTIMETVRGVFAALAVVGTLMLVRRRPARMPAWCAVALAGVGSGAMFGWGLWAMVVTLTEGPLAEDARPAAANLVQLFQTLTGLALGLAALAIVASRRQAEPEAGV